MSRHDSERDRSERILSRHIPVEGFFGNSYARRLLEDVLAWEIREHGVALCLVDLVDCVPAEEWKAREIENGQDLHVYAQRAMGDIDGPDRVVWVLRNRRVIEKPIPVKGRQGLWDFRLPLPAEVLT